MGQTHIIDRATLSQMFVKGNDYFTEEWLKQFLMNNFSKKLDNQNAFIGVIKFPDREFLTADNQFHTVRQFQNSIYVGYMDMVLPEPDNSSNETAFTRLSFNLDGVIRTFVNIGGGAQLDDNGQSFKAFVLSQYPTANQDFVFNHQGVHYLTDIVLDGAKYTRNNGGGFVVATEGQGAYTPSMQFEFQVSGYKCYML
jgi:hypothetical protein